MRLSALFPRLLRPRRRRDREHELVGHNDDFHHISFKESIFVHIYNTDSNQIWSELDPKKIINEVAVATTVVVLVALVAKLDVLGVTSSLEQLVHAESKKS